MKLIFRPMREGDLDQVLAIEEASFLSPWCRRSFENELEKEFSLCFVAVVEDRVVGYLIEWLVADEVHISNIAVHPAWRRQGIGERLVQKGMAECRGFSRVGLEVRRSNTSARSLYRRLGFREMGIHKSYYVLESEDAILMAKRLEPEE